MEVSNDGGDGENKSVVVMSEHTLTLIFLIANYMKLFFPLVFNFLMNIGFEISFLILLY